MLCTTSRPCAPRISFALDLSPPKSPPMLGRRRNFDIFLRVVEDLLCWILHGQMQ
jgi:hypothetical protein